MKQPLAIVGASTRAAAASAVRAGFQPLAADLFADADLRQIATATRISPYPEGLLDWLRAVEPPAWMYTGALENHPELVDQMAWISPLYGNPGDVLERVRSPWELARVLQKAGLQFPETRPSCRALPGDGSWLLKTYRGASGSGVRVLGPDTSSGSGERVVYQKRVEGVPFSAIYVAADGAALLLGATRQLVGEDWLGAREFQYCGSIAQELSRLQSEHIGVIQVLQRIGNVLSAEFELSGLFGVDLVISGTNVWTIEVNPRYTASVEIIERASGITALNFHAAACINGTMESIPSMSERDGSVHGKAIVFAKKDVVVPAGLAEEYLADAMAKPWPTLADVPSADTKVDEGRPVLTVFVEGESATDVEYRLRQRVAEIEKQLYARTT